ncbi:MAG: ABC transporter substrate-binding protein [Henriciella sp.]
MRIVSLDYCADQYVLKFVDRDRILAVSPDAGKPFSYMRDDAAGLDSVRPLAEDVLLRQPDLIVRSYGGGPDAEAFFESAGIPVLNVGWASDMDGIRRVTQDMADGLGETSRGQALVAEFDARLASLRTRNQNRHALYMTPSGATTGPGSLVHEMLRAAGLENFQDEPGWRSLPLERLAYEQPDLIAAAFFENQASHKDEWSAMRHPIAREQMRDQPAVMLQGAWTSCGAWFLLDAVEALAEAPMIEARQ